MAQGLFARISASTDPGAKTEKMQERSRFRSEECLRREVRSATSTSISLFPLGPWRHMRGAESGNEQEVRIATARPLRTGWSLPRRPLPGANATFLCPVGPL